MATSYLNTDGQGSDRRIRISATQTSGLFNSGATTFATGTANGYGRTLFDNSSANTDYVPTGTGFIGKSLTFDFSWPRVIDEITFTTELANNQGSWDVAGSNDGSSWTTLGSGIASGAATSHVLAFTNSTAYRYYRMTGASGSVTQSWWREVTFKIESPAAAEALPQYYNSGGHGARTASITVTADSGLFDTTANLSDIVSGVWEGTTRYVPTGAGFIGKSVTFDFGSGVAKRITEISVMTETGGNQGSWDIKGSMDGSSWTTISSAVAPTITGHRNVYAFTNNDTYRYYRMTGASGSVTQTFWKDVEFKTATTAYTPLQITTTTLNGGVSSVAYSATIAAIGGTAPYSFAVTTGALPTGLTLATNGTISGTTGSTGTFEFTVTVTDNVADTDTQDLTLIISPRLARLAFFS